VEDLAAFFERLQIMWAEATAGVREWVRQFGQAFNNALQPVRDWYGGLEQIFDKVGETVGRGIQTAIDWIILFPARVSEAFSEVSASIGQHITEAVNWLGQLPAMASQVLQQAGAAIQQGLQTIAQFFEDHKLAVIGILAALGVAIVIFFTGLPASIVGAATAFVIFVGSMFTNAKLAAASQLEQTKTTVKSKWEEIKTDITTKLQEIYDNIIQWLTDLGTSISTKWEEIRAAANTKWEEIKTTISAWVEDTIKTISDKWEGFKTSLRDIWESIRITADDYWSSIKDTIKAQVNQIIAFVNKFINYWNNIKIQVPQIYIPLVGTVGGYTIGVPQIPKIPFLAEGGIVTRDQIVRVAEDNHPEGVIPLSSSRARPFAEMIADAIATVIPQQTVSSGPSLPPLYVGTLIADDRGIKELYRRMEIIRIQEIQRRGGKP
jgi:phage-related protein